MGIKAQGDLTKDFFEEFTDTDGSVKSVKDTELENFMHLNQKDALAKGVDTTVVKQFFDYIPIHVLLPWLQALTPIVNKNADASEKVASLGQSMIDALQIINGIVVRESLDNGGYVYQLAPLVYVTDDVLHVTNAIGVDLLITYKQMGLEDAEAEAKKGYVIDKKGIYYLSAKEIQEIVTNKFVPIPFFVFADDEYDPEGETAVNGKAVAAALGTIEIPEVDVTDTYDPAGETAVNGKAVAAALGTIEIPEVDVTDTYDPAGETAASGKAIAQATRVPCGLFYVDDLRLDGIASASLVAGLVGDASELQDVNSGVYGRVFVADKASGNVYFVSVEDLQKKLLLNFDIEPIFKLPVDSYDPEGSAPVTGKAVAAALGAIEVPDAEVTHTYDPEGEAAISGKAVNAALKSSGIGVEAPNAEYLELENNADDYLEFTIPDDYAGQKIHIKNLGQNVTSWYGLCVWASDGTILADEGSGGSIYGGDTLVLGKDFGSHVSGGLEPGVTWQTHVPYNDGGGDADVRVYMEVYREQASFMPCTLVNTLPKPSEEHLNKVFKHEDRYYFLKGAQSTDMTSETLKASDVVQPELSSRSIIDSTYGYDSWWCLFEFECGATVTVWLVSNSYENSDYNFITVCGSGEPYSSNCEQHFSVDELYDGKITFADIASKMGYRGEISSVYLYELGEKLFPAGGVFQGVWHDFFSGKEM